jgi:hypothetical protein
MIVEVADKFRFSYKVVHMAAVYFDRLHGTTPQPKALASLACMIVAAKYLETSSHDASKLPTYNNVLAALGNPLNISTKHLVAWERRVLEVLNWRLSSATTLCFLDAYWAKGLFCAQDVAGPDRDRPPLPDEQTNVCKLIAFFCEFATLHGITYWNGASLTSAAAIGAARYTYGIFPTWPAVLAHRTGHTQATILSCMQTLLAGHQRLQKEPEPDQEKQTAN